MTRSGGGGCCDQVRGGGGREGGFVTKSWGEGGVVTRSLVYSSLPGPSDRMTNTCENITFARFATRVVMTDMYLHLPTLQASSESSSPTDKGSASDCRYAIRICYL